MSGVSLSGLSLSSVSLNGIGHITPGAPVASFTADVTSGALPFSVFFTDTSTGTPTSWTWNFGDGTTSTLQNPLHTYNTIGSYNVSVTVHNSIGTSMSTQPTTITTTAMTAVYSGLWNAASNIPSLNNSTGTDNSTYQVSTSGTVDFGAGPVTAPTGSYIRYQSGAWFVVTPPNVDAGYGTDYLGAWNPIVNYPLLQNGVNTTAGVKYRVSVSGAADFGAGSIDFALGDYVTYSGTEWEKLNFYAPAPDSSSPTPLAALAITAAFATTPSVNLGASTVSPAVFGKMGTENLLLNFARAVDMLDAASATGAPTNDGNGTDWNGLIELSGAATQAMSDNTVGAPLIPDDVMSQLTIEWFLTVAVSTIPGDLDSPIDIQKTFERMCISDPAATKELYDGLTNVLTNLLTSVALTPDDLKYIPQDEHAGIDYGTTLDVLLSTHTLQDLLGYLTGWRNSLHQYVDADAGIPTSIFTADKTIVLDPNNIRTITINSGETIAFTDMSTHNPDKWNWDFGDGTTSIEQNPTHTFTVDTQQDFTVDMYAANFLKRSANVDSVVVTVKPVTPTVSFTITPTTGNAPIYINLTDTTPGNPNNWVWDMGDGNISYGKNTAYIYQTPGTYTITLTVTYVGGATASGSNQFVATTTMYRLTFTDDTGTTLPIHSDGAQVYPVVSGDFPVDRSVVDALCSQLSGFAWPLNSGVPGVFNNPPQPESTGQLILTYRNYFFMDNQNYGRWLYLHITPL
jgi:PKD repeat protein